MKPVLLVEDNEVDILLMQHACERAGVKHTMHIVRDGEEAMAYLSGEGEFSDRQKHPLPELVFMDIKLPKLDGLEVLKWVRSQPLLADLPVIMLTNSTLQTDLQQAYQLGTSSYLSKSLDLLTFTADMKNIMKFWLELNV